MGPSVQLVAFRPAQGPPERLLRVSWEELMPWSEAAGAGTRGVFGWDVISGPACGCRIWLVDQVVAPKQARAQGLSTR